MTVTTFSSRDFNQDASGAKRAALGGPVIITDRGKPAHVLLTFEEYRRITVNTRKIADILAMPVGGDIEFNPPRLDQIARPLDLS